MAKNIQNIDRKISDLRERGFANPVNLISTNPAMLCERDFSPCFRVPQEEAPPSVPSVVAGGGVK